MQKDTDHPEHLLSSWGGGLSVYVLDQIKVIQQAQSWQPALGRCGNYTLLSLKRRGAARGLKLRDNKSEKTETDMLQWEWTGVFDSEYKCVCLRVS